jgi:hypothetical protein
LIDFAERINKHGADLLHPGEAVLGAIQLMPPTGVSWLSAGGATGGLLGAAAGAVIDYAKGRKDENRRTEHDAPAQAIKFPANAVAAVAVTDRRLAFFTLTEGRALPKELFLEIPYDELAGLQRQHEKKRVGLRFALKDGRVFDASTMVGWPNKKNAEQFFEAFEGRAGFVS